MTDPERAGPIAVLAAWISVFVFGLAFWALVIWVLIRTVAALGW